jgi:hypothetical protein
VALRAFWPAREPAQIGYETLRAAALAGTDLASVAAVRFARRGLAGVIAWPSGEPVLSATVVGALRPPWTPHSDPRLDALAGGFELLLTASVDVAIYTQEAHR